MEKILVSGSSGFIGNNLCKRLIQLKRHGRGTVRDLSKFTNTENFEYFSVKNIGPETNWQNILSKVTCIIHCAGIANEIKGKDDIDSYHFVNFEGTKHFAKQAAKAGVKKFIFLSSAKVNDESVLKIFNNKTEKNLYKKKFNTCDSSNSLNFYAKSKFEAEKALWKISADTGLEIVILRLPLVYGYGVKCNLLNLIKLIKYNVPLPFNLIKNQRSFLGIDNLIDILIHCVDHPKAAGKTFMVSDDEDLSTVDLIKHIAFAMNVKVRLFSFPIFFLKILSYMIGKHSEIDRLIGSLQVDISNTKKILNWKPPISVKEGIKRMIQNR